jgi:hypothetical protein
MGAIFARVRERAVATVREACAGPIAEDARLGFGHGLAGELWPLVQALRVGDPVASARLAELAALREVDEEDFVFWLSARGKWDLAMVGSLCNGVAGHSLLWSEVARQSRSAESLALARRAAESTAFLGDGTPGICCGLAGHSLALQRYADVSGDARFGRLAYARLARATREIAKLGPDHTLGFWQGALGVALVAAMLVKLRGSLPQSRPDCVHRWRRDHHGGEEDEEDHGRNRHQGAPEADRGRLGALRGRGRRVHGDRRRGREGEARQEEALSRG